MTYARFDGRQDGELRPVSFQLDFQRLPKASVLSVSGNTRVVCSVSVSPGVPSWMREQGKSGGWLTAEYRMMPGSTIPRQNRKESGRSTEIQRLIGRTLRSVVDLEKLGNHTVVIDCDVLDADGGTRCCSINGSVVALALAFQRMVEEGTLSENPLRGFVAAVSVGRLEGHYLLDLNYVEDSQTELDLNVIMTSDGEFCEIQGGGEEATFSRTELLQCLDIAEIGIRNIIEEQKKVLSSYC